MSEVRDKRRLQLFALGSLLVLGVAWYLLFQRQASQSPQAMTQPPSVAEIPETKSNAPLAEVPESKPAAIESVDPRTLWINDLTAWLEQQGDSDSLMTAALIIHSEKSRSVQMREAREKTLSLLRRALAARPDDPLLARLGLFLCEAKYGCNPQEFERSLRANDPENALGWLSDLQRASSAQDSDAIAAAIKEMAKRPRFDFYSSRMNSTLIERASTARVNPPRYPAGAEAPSFTAEVSLLSGAVGVLLPRPSLRSIIDACQNSVAPDLRADCRKVVDAMKRGDTMIGQTIGAQLSDQMDRSNGAQTGAADSRRKLDWLMFNLQQIQVQPAYLRQLIAESGGEIQAYQRLLRENGIPLDPPKDWNRP